MKTGICLLLVALFMVVGGSLFSPIWVCFVGFLLFFIGGVGFVIADIS